MELKIEKGKDDAFPLYSYNYIDMFEQIIRSILIWPQVYYAASAAFAFSASALNAALS